MPFLLIFLFVLLLHPISSTICPPNPFQSYLINGDQHSNPSDILPFMATIRSSDNTLICSAILISPHWLLTAALCIASRTDEAFVASHALIASKSFPPTTKHFIEHVFTPPFGFDIAAIKIAPAHISLDKSGAPLPFPAVNTNHTNPLLGSFARAAGYGRSAPSSTSHLQQVVHGVLPRRLCNPSKRLLPRGRYLCAACLSGACGTCFGDIGGPLLQYRAGRPVVMGIALGLFGRYAEPNLPQLYANVSEKIAWLRRKNVIFEGVAQVDVVRANTGTVTRIEASNSPQPPSQSVRPTRSPESTISALPSITPRPSESVRESQSDLIPTPTVEDNFPRDTSGGGLDVGRILIVVLVFTVAIISMAICINNCRRPSQLEEDDAWSTEWVERRRS